MLQHGRVRYRQWRVFWQQLNKYGIFSDQLFVNERDRRIRCWVDDDDGNTRNDSRAWVDR
jgi:hypothetical protein